MPKYKANTYLVHNGAIVQTEQEFELSEELADRLGDKVTLVEKEEKKATKNKKSE